MAPRGITGEVALVRLRKYPAMDLGRGCRLCNQPALVSDRAGQLYNRNNRPRLIHRGLLLLVVDRQKSRAVVPDKPGAFESVKDRLASADQVIVVELARPVADDFDASELARQRPGQAGRPSPKDALVAIAQALARVEVHPLEFVQAGRRQRDFNLQHQGSTLVCVGQPRPWCGFIVLEPSAP